MRRKKDKSRRLAAGLLVLFSACSMIPSPAGFWRQYRSDLISAQDSDQGPWGGYRWIQWTAVPGTFRESEVRNFAEREGWKFIDRTVVSSDEEKKWTDFQGKATFPLPSPRDYSDDYPRHVAGPSILLLRFATGWNREDPGTNEMSPAYGYVLFSKDGSRMAVYHQWGNG